MVVLDATSSSNCADSSSAVSPSDDEIQKLSNAFEDEGFNLIDVENSSTDAEPQNNTESQTTKEAPATTTTAASTSVASAGATSAEFNAPSLDLDEFSKITLELCKQIQPQEMHLGSAMQITMLHKVTTALNGVSEKLGELITIEKGQDRKIMQCRYNILEAGKSTMEIAWKSGELSKDETVSYLFPCGHRTEHYFDIETNTVKKREIPGLRYGQGGGNGAETATASATDATASAPTLTATAGPSASQTIAQAEVDKHHNRYTLGACTLKASSPLGSPRTAIKVVYDEGKDSQAPASVPKGPKEIKAELKKEQKKLEKAKAGTQ